MRRARAAPLPVRRGTLEEERAGLRPDLGVLAAHDPRERDRPLAVGDDEVRRLERPRHAVERDQPFARSRPAHHDPTFREPFEVEGVERLPPLEHDVVAGVDDVRLRAHAGACETKPEPERRGAHVHPAHDARAVARAEVRGFDPDGDLTRGRGTRFQRRTGAVGPARSGSDLARHTEYGEAVAAIGRDLELEPRIGMLAELTSPFLPRVLGRARIVSASSPSRLGLGAEHPLRTHSTI